MRAVSDQERRARWVAAACASVASVIGGFGTRTIALDAAIGILLAGFALFAQVRGWRRASVGLTILVILLSVLTVRTSLPTASSLLALGLSLALQQGSTHRARVLAHALALVTLAFALVELFGHAFLSAAGIGLLAIGILATPPLVGLSALLVRRTAGGHAARTLLPATVAIPFGFAIVTILGEQAGWYGSAVAEGFHVVLTTVALIGVVAWAALSVDRVDTVNEQLQEQAAQLEEQAVELEQQVDETRLLSEQLDERERRLRRVIESDMIGIVFWDAAGQITEANNVFLRIVGYTRDDLAAGRVQWRHMTPPKWLPADERALAQIAAQGTCVPFEKEYFRKDGTRVPVMIGASALDGDRARGVAFVLDITDRVAVRQALELSEARYRLLFDANPMPMWVYDRQTLRFLAVNRAAIEHYGYTREEFGAMTLYDIRPTEDREVLDAILAQGGVESLSAPVPVRHKRKDGTVFDVEITVDSIEFDGRPARLALAQDVTARRAAQRAAQEALTAAQAADRAKSQFLAVMSHELRTPLNAIIGYGELLNLEICGPVTDDQREKLGRMQVSAAHLVGLIGQVLDFERVEAGRQEIVTEPAEIGAIVHAAAADVEPQVMRKGLVLAIELPATPVIITTDVAKLRQIVSNLLSNAVKYTDAGEIRVSARVVGSDVELVVRDTGIGIDPEHRDRIFDPFWQVNQRLTRTTGGAGLGLTIVQRFVQLLGGHISVSSSLGQGSTFTLRLPIWLT